ncbi:hypothetical protein OS493_038250 [Desmophyllum pertusum]|uniref:Uncharacterized protein n=1 Tax=Desmophyllum pertusum TaxID=174260 RepID=A0A9X0D834_9CNID|nr:hypothetical protein OS493_038250 [Desmophyllum pertusum]
MSLKFVVFLCGFLVSLTPAVFSLQCYTKFCSGDDCFPQGVRTCPNAGEKCGTLSATRGSTPVIYGNCSNRCDEPNFCSNLVTAESSSQNPISNCLFTCCNTDLCDPLPQNDQGSAPTTAQQKKKLNKEMKAFTKLLEKVEKSHHQ